MVIQALRLACKQQRYAPFSLGCHVLALSAIMVPILIILGLKYGLVSGMKERLLHNPSTLEIRMLEATDIDNERLEHWRNWEESGYIQPCAGIFSSSISIRKAETSPDEASDKETYSLLPTSDGDPVMLLSEMPQPHEGEILLSSELANHLQIGVGEEVILTKWRDARRQKQESRHRVTGIIPKESKPGKCLYAPFDFVMMTEEFAQQGQGFPNAPAQVEGKPYSAIILQGEKAQETAGLLQNNSSAFHSCQATEDSHPGISNGTWLVDDSILCVSGAEVDSLVELARTTQTEAYPWIPPQQIELDPSLPICLITLPWIQGSASQCEAPPIIKLSEKGNWADHVTLNIPCPDGISKIVCRTQISPEIAEGQAEGAPQLAALVRQASNSLTIWDYRTGSLRHPILRFQAARLYSNRLENVEPMLHKLQSEGVKCTADLYAIQQVLTLEDSLNKLFIIIASSAGAGAIASFSMSLFNATEIHRKDYALIQLLGAGRLSLSLIPIADAILTTILSLAIAFGAFYLAGSAIQLLFPKTLAHNGLCRLEWGHCLLFSITCLATAFISSLAASVRVLRITPADIIRES